MLVCHSHNEYLLIGTIHAIEIIAANIFVLSGFYVLISGIKYKINEQGN